MKHVIPMKTVSESNQREHWRKRARRAKQQRGAAFLIVSASGGAYKCMRFPRLTITRVAPRRLDDDNLRGALKAVRDGIADALSVNDGDPSILWEYRQRRGGRHEYAVEIEIDQQSDVELSTTFREQP